MTAIRLTTVRALVARFGLGKVPVLSLMGLLWLPAHGTTAMEDQMKKAPMPHEGRGAGGTLVKVHWVSSRGYMGGTRDNAAQLARLRADVQECIKHAASSQVKPVKAWPDFVNSNRTDIYASANRSISYQSGLMYALNPLDCGLLEISTSSAELSSPRGQCTINLIKKSAHGNCDSKAHSDAPLPKRAPPSSLSEVEAAAKRTPDSQALAALAAAMKRHAPTSTGEYKTIAGLKCEVWRNPLFPDGTGCLSLGGSFVASHAAAGLSQSSMELEMTSTNGAQSRAVVAQLDTLVDGSVFAPYLAPGFTIKNSKASK